MALYGWPIIQIVHDYTPVCPKSTCIRDDGAVCLGMDFTQCIRYCKYHRSMIQLQVKRLLTSIVNIIRRLVIKQYVSPSQCLCDYLTRAGFECQIISNPMPFTPVTQKELDKIYSAYHQYIYIGALNDNKGIYELLPAFQVFAAGKNVKLHLYGRITDSQTKQFVLRYQSEKIIYHGMVPHDEINHVLSRAYAMIVPSKWMENYPTTVMEGMMNRILVIGSDRGGIPEQLADDRGIIYHWGRDGLVDALQKAEQMGYEKYSTMTELAARYVMENNAYQKYHVQFMNLVNRVMEK